ncbi:MAG: DUF4197 domain-containing protein [Flavobacteriaceae bacterium]
MKKQLLLLIMVLVQLSANAQFSKFLKQITGDEPTKIDMGDLTNIDIGNGLKEALDKGITEQVLKLAVKDGFYKNDLVKIIFPEELQKVDRALRSVGLSDLADEGIKMLNRAAEDAVEEAVPIFVDAIKGMTITDAKDILLGDDNAATTYLQNQTSEAIYEKFRPIIGDSFQKVGADKVWENLIKTYNKIPFSNDVNPDLTSYVTGESLKSVYKVVAIEEQEIRTKIGSRNTDLLKKVFALQDGN